MKIKIVLYHNEISFFVKGRGHETFPTNPLVVCSADRNGKGKHNLKLKWKETQTQQKGKRKILKLMNFYPILGLKSLFIFLFFNNFGALKVLKLQKLGRFITTV